MKIFKYPLIDLANDFEKHNGKGRVWINAGFCDEFDPTTWNNAMMNTPFNYKVAFSCDAQNKMWVKCIPKEIDLKDLVRGFVVTDEHHFHWVMQGY